MSAKRIGCLLSLLLAVSCGVPATTRQAATTVVDELARAVRAREDAYEQLLRRVLTECYQHVLAELNAKWALQRAELRLQVTDKIYVKRTELLVQIRSEMTQALGARVEQMSQALEAAKADVAAGKGGEDKRNELALQLAATLAHIQKTVGELDEKVEEQLAAVMKETLAKVDLEMATNPVAFDSAAQVELAMKDLRQRTDANFLMAYDQGATELKRYIAMDSAPALVLKGLFGEAIGDKLFATVQTFANAKLQELTDTVVKKATSLAAGQDKALAESIQQVK